MARTMKIRQVICAPGRSGYMHRDLMAIKAGAKADGFLYHGKALSPGFTKIVEAARAREAAVAIAVENMNLPGMRAA